MTYRVLALTKYDALAASTRYRFLQYVEPLAKRGIELTHSPLFDDAYLKHKFEASAHPRDLLRAMARRMKALVRTNRYDLVIVYLELFPYLPALAEVLLSVSGTRYVVDMDDAIFHQYDSHRSRLVRMLLSRKIRTVLQRAQAVLCGNHYLEAFAERHNTRAVYLPTVVDTDYYRPALPTRTETFRVGWVGSPSTVLHLKLVAPALRRLDQERKSSFILVGSGPVELHGLPAEVRPWRQETELDDLTSFDVGIMPLLDFPWARGKCAFKLIQYMACGLPVVASPLGANLDVVDPSCGFFASTTEEWIHALRRVADDPAASAELGRNGRRIVEERFSVKSQEERLAETLIQAIEDRMPPRSHSSS